MFARRVRPRTRWPDGGGVPMRKLSLAAVLACGVLASGALMFATAAHAALTCTRTWDGGASTNQWTDAMNWSADTLPGVNDTACIPQTVLTNVQIANGETVDVKFVSLQEALVLDGSLSLSGTSDPSVAAAVTIEGNGVLTGAGTLNVSGAF